MIGSGAEEEAEAGLAGGVGGPSPEDWANGEAALAAGLVREARALAETAAALRRAAAPAPGEPPGDVRRLRAALHTAGEAALRAALALEAAEALAQPGADAAARARRIAEAARRAGAAPAAVAPLLRAAALAFRSDDAAARIAAGLAAQELAARLAAEPGAAPPGAARGG